MNLVRHMLRSTFTEPKVDLTRTTKSIEMSSTENCKKAQVEAGIYIIKLLLFSNLIRHILRSTLNPKLILRRSNRRPTSIRRTESIETQSVDLNWDKRRSTHAKIEVSPGPKTNIEQKL